MSQSVSSEISRATVATFQESQCQTLERLNNVSVVDNIILVYGVGNQIV